MDFTSTLMQRAWLAMRAGFAFRGARDYYQVFGYTRILKPEDLLAKFERQDIVQRIVCQPAEATWAYPPTVVQASAQSLWEKLQEHKILSALLQADKLLCFGPYAILWLGLPGNSETAATSTKVDDIAFISAHGANAVKILKTEENTASPRYGLPTMYEVTIDRAGVPASAQMGKKVHWTRVIHVCDVPLQGRAYSIPRLQPIYNLLDDILKIAGASAETFWLAANRGLQVDVDKEMVFGEGDAKALADEVDEYQHQLRRVLKTRGVKVTSLGSDVADPQGTFNTLIGLLSSATNIPQRVLMGAEAGQLASQQDRANWSEYIERRRSIVAEPYILGPVFEAMASLKMIGAEEVKKLEYVWPPAFRQNPLEISQTMSAKARALINLSRQSQYGTPYVGFGEGRELMGLPKKLPTDDFLPMTPATPSATAGGAAKRGGSKASGGAGGNDGSGDSGGGAQETTTIPVADGTADTASN